MPVRCPLTREAWEGEPVPFTAQVDSSKSYSRRSGRLVTLYGAQLSDTSVPCLSLSVTPALWDPSLNNPVMSGLVSGGTLRGNQEETGCF